MTKTEFVDLVARDERIGSKKHAAEAVEAVLDAIGAPRARGGDLNIKPVGKIKHAPRRPPRCS